MEEEWRLIFHVDVNSAFLSWTSVKRLREGKSDLRNVPAIISGDPGLRTSIVAAKSIPAAKLGIHTGEASSMAMQKCPELVVAPPDRAWYKECSRRFIAVCRDFTPVLEQASIDECYLDMTGMGKLWPDPLRAAAAIRERVRTELGFTVNVGIAHNKLLAKMASDMEKPDKTHTLFEDEIPRKLWPMPVGKLFLVGGHSADRLRKAGIYTIGDLAACDMASLSSLLGVKTAQLYHDFANGIDPSKVLDHPEEAKGYSASTTTEEDLADREKLHAILRELADTAASRMRRDGLRTQCVGVKIRSGSFSNRTNRSHQKKLSQASDITAEITGAAVALFDELWDGRTPLRLIGISLTDVTKEQAVQLSLFGDAQREKEKKADAAVDEIRRKFGGGAIHRGAPPL